MKIEITDRCNIRYISKYRPYVIISITSPNRKFCKLPWFGRKAYLRLIFADTTDPDDSLGMFTTEQADIILDFVKRYRDYRVICQCDAGVSRSAAVAAAISKIYNQHDSNIFSNIQYNPNLFVYKTILKQYNNSI